MVSSTSPDRSSPIAGPSSHDESAHSSPRPASEIGLPDQRQRDQDVHLAHSMNQTNAFVRTRSNTMMERAEMATPQRLNSDGRQNSEGVSGSRRRGSVSVQPSRAMDHLADDLEISAHQDSHQDRRFFDGDNSSPSGAGAGGSGSRSDRRQRFAVMPHHTPSSVQHSAAAARLYRHHRNLSESSIDSQGGAYIDHRRQPHSLSLMTGTPGRMAGPSSGGGAGGMAHARSPDGYGRAGDLRRGSGGDEPMDDFALGRPYPAVRHSSSRSAMSPTDLDDPGQSAISTRTTRGFTTEDLDENPIADEGGRVSPRQHLQRHPSQKSYQSIPSSRHSLEQDHHSGEFDNQLSRQGSFTGPPEDDICYPAHGAAPEVDLIDIGYPEHHEHHEHQDSGVPGVLHNFPFPFNFGVLEEFAEREKEGMPIPGARKRAQRGPGGGLSTGVSPPGYGTSAVSNRAAFSSGSEGDQPRRMGRQRKLSESVAPGRYRRKLALFEGAGDDDEGGPTGPPPEPTVGRNSFATILDTKTPLLDKRDTGVAGGGYGAAGGQPRAATGAAGGARPYRFSFYSNALPSTIHARSLAEIPAEGQTFEELFVGRQEPTFEEEQSSRTSGGGTAHDLRTTHFSPPSATGTGANTPNGAASSAGVNAAMHSAKPAGVPQAGLAAEARARADRLRTGLIRSDVDAEANTWWLDVLCPTDAEMKVLSKVFGIHPLTTEDIQMEETREKIELFRNYYFVCFRSFEQDPYSPTYLEPLNMYIIVFREGTLSFHFRGTPHPQNVRRRIKQLKDYINVTSDWISYALIDDITDAFGPLIQNIEYEVDSIDELVLILKEAEQSDMLRRIGTCRKKVMGLLRLMGNKADVVKGLSKRCNENWSVAPKSDIGLYLSDIQDHITTSTQNLTHYEKILSRSHSNYLAQISIEMTDANNQINDVLSKLTALGTVLIPMNLITGLWGMNVNVPGQDVENLHWFFSIIGCLGAIAMGGAWLTYRVFVRSS